MALEDVHLDVLQNIEFAIVSVYRKQHALRDVEVMRALNALIDVYRAKARGHTPKEVRRTNMVTLQLRQLHVPPGQRLLIEDVTWADFEAIVEELGEHRGTRVAYSQGVLEIVSPLPAHEKAKVIISDLVKILLDELDMPWESLGSTTFRRAEMAAGIEPDDCFYIQHHAAMVGKERLDLRVDPPPDLVIEVDITSPTALQAYAALQVPEIWRYHNRTLQIAVWHDGRYID